MDALSQQHIDWLRAQNDWAENTIASRTRVLRSVGNAGTATREDLETWWQTRTHLAPGTRAVDLSHLREFYKWCMIYEHLDKDPSIRIRAPRQGNVVHEHKISDEDVQNLIDALGGTTELARCVMLGAGAGLRVAESAALDWSHINSAEDTIRVERSKGMKTRLVHVSPELISMLARGVPERVGNVVRAGGEPYSAAQLQRKLNRAIRATGSDLTSHELRHRFGIAAYRASGDILAVGEMMGHESVNTTKIYASADSDVKRKIATAVMW